MSAMHELSTNNVLNAYANGIFPMAESKESDKIGWYAPAYRGVFPLDKFHISHSLKRSLCRDDYIISLNTAFENVLSACADRPQTWINAQLKEIYITLHAQGMCHSLEIWRKNQLIGGIFGVTLAGAFFGESMFSKAKDASKIALCWTVDRLNRAGFTVFDTQFITPHLASLGAIEIPRKDYEMQLKTALSIRANFIAPSQPCNGKAVFHGIKHRTAQTS